MCRLGPSRANGFGSLEGSHCRQLTGISQRTRRQQCQGSETAPNELTATLSTCVCCRRVFSNGLRSNLRKVLQLCLITRLPHSQDTVTNIPNQGTLAVVTHSNIATDGLITCQSKWGQLDLIMLIGVLLDYFKTLLHLDGWSCSCYISPARLLLSRMQ